MDPTSENLGFILFSRLLNAFRAKRSDAVRIVASWIRNVCTMLPQSELIKDLKRQLIKIDRVLLVEPEGISLEVTLDHLTAILQDLLSIFAMNSTNKTQAKHIQDNLVFVIMALLSLSLNVSGIFPHNSLFHHLLTQLLTMIDSKADRPTGVTIIALILYIFSMKRISIVFKGLESWVLEVSGMFPESELLLYLQSKIMCTGVLFKLRTPKDAILDYLIDILQDLLSQLMKPNLTSGMHKKTILNHFMGIVIALLSLSGGISQTAHEDRIITLIGMLSRLLNSFVTEGYREAVKFLVCKMMNVCDMFCENEVLKDLYTELKNLLTMSCSSDSHQWILNELNQKVHFLTVQVMKLKSCLLYKKRGQELLLWINTYKYFLCENVTKIGEGPMSGELVNLHAQLKKMAENNPEFSAIQDPIDAQFKNIASRLISISNALNKNKYLDDLHLQLSNILNRFHSRGGINNYVILDHIVALLQDLTSHLFMGFNPEELKFRCCPI